MNSVIMNFICPFCGEKHGVKAPEKEYIAYCEGHLVQNAFKSLTSTQREQIISGICPRCQEDIFREEEDA